MGNAKLTTLPENSKNKKTNILEDFLPHKKITDPRYGEATLMKHKLSKHLAILKEITTNDSRENIAISLKWNHRLEMQHPNILQVLGNRK